MRSAFSDLNLDADSQRALEVLSATDRIDYGLIAAVVKHIMFTAETTDGAILIFMPGVMEIRQCISELESINLGSTEIIPLHANLSSMEQRRIFLPTSPKRKIVVATNVAETSVTIPDVVFVVDSGRVKETQYDGESGMQRLVEDWTSRASGRQRRGRAGRTSPGHASDLPLKDPSRLTRHSAINCTLDVLKPIVCTGSRCQKSFVHRSRACSYR